MQDALIHRVITVTTSHPAWRREVKLTFNFDASDGFNNVNQFVDGDQFTRAQVDRGGDQFLITGDHVDALRAVVDIYEIARGSAVARDHDGVASGVVGFNHFAGNCRGSFFPTAVPSSVPPINTVEAGDGGFHSTLGPILVADRFRKLAFALIELFGLPTGGICARRHRKVF